MNPSAYRVRRATVDDLPFLLALWESMSLPTPEREKRLTEFQVVELPEGGLAGALGIEISGRHGRIHSEAFGDFALAEVLREQLWQRLQSVACNHGLVRLWTLETAPFWKQSGFCPANEEALKKIPATWATDEPDWLTLKLREEAVVEASLEREFKRLREEAQVETRRTFRHGRALKFIATVLAIVLAIFVVLFLFWTLQNNSRLPHR